MKAKLRQARQEKGLTQAHVAQKIGISSRHYQNIETGTRKGSIDLWLRLSYLFGRTINELLE